ncbi:probable WRKY transcription factor 3 [Lotus japonicus]|uniref:probable WRKY transcription factor 3 n=1 Tax=Lotus japonicus TaxID=34305 RepID=UPI00258C8BA7|nr:probable WRKY transcription factor 3 [Lotus japonicus]
MEDFIDFSHFEGVNSFSLNVEFHDDGYNWKKYGYKQVKDFLFTRSYYMCTHQDCPVKKNVVHSLDGHVTELGYKGNHNHQPHHPNNLTSNESSIMKESMKTTVQHVSEISERQEIGGQELVEKNDEPDPKRRNTQMDLVDIPISSRFNTLKDRLIVKIISDVDILDDGYKWRKYGQKAIKGSPNPRSYYRCTTPSCIIRKHVERDPTDIATVITTYEGKHNHDVPPPTTKSLILAKASALRLRS